MEILDKIKILAENENWIAVFKPATLPTQDDETGDISLAKWLQDERPDAEIFVIHRLDRVASGVVVFAKKQATAKNLSQKFRDRKPQKRYLAWVSAAPPNEAGLLVHYLKKHKNTKAVVKSKPEPDFDRAELYYQQIGQSANYFLLDIELKTGRFHQIRAQLAAIGCPIKGDVKYGARRSNPDRSIHLLAWQLTISPDQIFESPFPTDDPLWTLAQEIVLEVKS